MSRFSYHCARHFPSLLKKIRKNNRFMTIEEGRFPYEFFNICFLNNVIGLIVYALYRGCLPLIQIKNQQEQENLWEWYFEQPFERKEDAEIIVCDRTYTNYRPNVRTGFGENNEDFFTWAFFYQTFVRFKDSVWKYIQQEIDDTGIRGNSLGLLIRGTDYTASRPKGHPVQPTINELIQKAAEYHRQYSYSAIYVATEEEQLFHRISDAFGQDLVRANRRRYYDEQFYQKGMQFIGEVKFDRINDNYWKGLEYLSSLVILSNCTDLVAGNCGGTEFAVLFTKGYRNKYIFNKGLY